MSFSPDEPASVIRKERGLLAGIGLGLAAWGILLTLSIQCCSALTAQIRSKPSHRWLLAYVIAMFALGTVGIFTHLKWVQVIEIDNRNFPGGPLAYDAEFYANTVNVLGVVAEFIMNWLADGLLIYRMYIIWDRRLLVIAFPATMFATSFSLSVADLVALSRPGHSMFTLSVVNFGLLYWSFSIALNVLVTGLIVGRLLYMRVRVRGAVSRGHSRVYVGISAMLIESAALYSISAIVFLVGYALQSPLQFAAEAVEQLQGVAPLMIILRVASGRAWSDDTSRSLQTSSLPAPVFSRRRDNATHNSGSEGTYSMNPAAHKVTFISEHNSTTTALDDDSQLESQERK